MLPDRVSNPGPLTYESGALPIALRGPAKVNLYKIHVYLFKLRIDLFNISLILDNSLDFTQFTRGLLLHFFFFSVLIVVLNCVYIQYVTRVQGLLSATKIVAMVMIIICGIYGLAQGK